MASSETPKRKRRKIIRIRRKVNNNNNNNTSAAQLELEETLLEILRNKLIQIIAAGNDGKNLSPEQQMSVVNAGYQYLATHGFDGFELKRAWRELSRWRA